MKLTAQLIISALFLYFLIAPWFYNDLFWKFCAGSVFIISILLSLLIAFKKK